MTKNHRNTFEDLKCGTIMCFKISMVFTIIFSAFLGSDFNLKNVLLTFFLSCLYSFGLGFGNGYLNVLLDRKWDWLEQTNLRVYYGILVTVLYTVPAVLGIDYVIFVIVQDLPLGKFFSERMIW